MSRTSGASTSKYSHALQELTVLSSLLFVGFADVGIGYKLKALENDTTRNFGIFLIPPKNLVVTVGKADALLVVAEDER